VRQLTGVKDNTNVPSTAKDGRLLLSEREQNLRWKEHFEEVLNQPEPLLTADFGDTVMADSLEFYEGHINIEEVQRAVTEQVFTLQNIIEQSLEHQQDLIINFIDYKKAFDSVHRPSLWKILKYYGIRDRFINIFKALHINSSSCQDRKWVHGLCTNPLENS